MKKFKSTIPNGGLEFFNKYLSTELSAEIWDAIQALINQSQNTTEGFILKGGTVAGTAPSATITDSIVILNGKILRLEADTGLSYPFYIQEATATTENGSFADGSSQAVIDIEKAETASSAPVSGQYVTVSAAGEYAIGLFANGLIDTENNVRLSTKVIEIGDWDMDANAQLNLTVPGWDFAEYKKIRSMSVIIRDDTDSYYRNLLEAGHYIFPNIVSADIRLNRDNAGLFDSTSYDSTSYNRGWVYITYEV